MGECGCSMCGQAFKLPAPDGWYVIRTMPGCRDCDGPAGIVIQHIDHEHASWFGDDFLRELPMFDAGDFRECVIQAGPTVDEARKAFTSFFVGAGLSWHGQELDTIGAEVLAEDFWREHMESPPKVIDPAERGTE